MELSHFGNDAQLVLTCTNGNLTINIQQSFPPSKSTCYQFSKLECEEWSHNKGNSAQAKEAVHLPDEHCTILFYLLHKCLSFLLNPKRSLPSNHLNKFLELEKLFMMQDKKPSFPPSSAAVADQGGHTPPLAPPAPGRTPPSAAAHQGGHPPPLAPAPAPGLPPLSAAAHQGGHSQKRKARQPIKRKMRAPSDQPSPSHSIATTNNSPIGQSHPTPPHVYPSHQGVSHAR